MSADPSKGGGRLLGVKTLQRNHDTREFLRLAGYKQAPDQELELELDEKCRQQIQDRQYLSKVK